jgi:HD-GYP domain-containing protein (c-di-GMP phosphodiesterase class II)
MNEFKCKKNITKIKKEPIIELARQHIILFQNESRCALSSKIRADEQFCSRDRALLATTRSSAPTVKSTRNEDEQGPTQLWLPT